MGRHHRQIHKQQQAVTVAAAAPAGPAEESQDRIVAAFDSQGSPVSHVAPFYGGVMRGISLIDRQKFRNNWSKQPIRSQISAVRHYASYNWFLNPVLSLRAASHGAGFRVVGEEVDYDVESLVEDIVEEDLVSSNIVCLWRKGVDRPTITVLDAERVEYSSIGGIEKILLQCSADRAMAADKDNEDIYRKELGDTMYDACCRGTCVKILRGYDKDWNFAYMGRGKRRGCFATPALIGLLDALDYLELMGVGDWNLAMKRKDLIQLIKKGFKVTTGGNAVVNSVNITKPDVTTLGEGFSNLNGISTVPLNHDIDVSYLTVDPVNFKPEMIKSATDKIMLYGGIEAVVILGEFSQQNGAAPSLMRNARTEAFARRGRIERLLRTIGEEPEFSGVFKNPRKVVFGWSVKSLYSIEELNQLSNGMAPGLGSPKTRRGLYDLDDDQETERMLEAHANRKAYTPAFEAGQGMVPLVFPGEFASQASNPSGEPGNPGRPTNDPGV
jgi:hypothetical protein